MYPNLRAEMARKGITAKQLAEQIGITASTFSLKMRGEYDFTMDEAIKIKAILEVNLSLETLFEKAAA